MDAFVSDPAEGESTEFDSTICRASSRAFVLCSLTP